MKTTMRAAVLHTIGDLRVETRPVTPPGPGQTLLRVRRAGICGTDIHYFHEGRFGKFAVTAPFILGHEVMGEVVAIGDGPSNLATGQRVVVDPSWHCGHCDYCRSGRGNLCRHVRMLGSASTKPPTNGAFSEYLLIASQQCYPIPDSLSDSSAAMMEPLCVALQAARRAVSVTQGGALEGKRVLVTGGGPIGLLVVKVARAFGAVNVTLSDPTASRREFARDCGADVVVDPSAGTLLEQVDRATEFDVMFEASGAVAAIQSGLETVRRGGTIVQVGVSSEHEIALDVNQVMIRELQYVGSFRYGDVWETGIRLLATRRLEVESLVSNVCPLDGVTAALQAAADRDNSVKVQLDLS